VKTAIYLSILLLGLTVFAVGGWIAAAALGARVPVAPGDRHEIRVRKGTRRRRLRERRKHASAPA
jgi:hypothetical protein